MSDLQLDFQKKMIKKKFIAHMTATSICPSSYNHSISPLHAAVPPGPVALAPLLSEATVIRCSAFAPVAAGK